MEPKRAEMPRASHGRPVRLAVAVGMFEMRAVGVQGVVVLVLNVPAGSSGLHDGLHAGAIPVVRRRKGMARAEGAVGGCGAGVCTMPLLGRNRGGAIQGDPPLGRDAPPHPQGPRLCQGGIHPGPPRQPLGRSSPP